MGFGAFEIAALAQERATDAAGGEGHDEEDKDGDAQQRGEHEKNSADGVAEHAG